MNRRGFFGAAGLSFAAAQLGILNRAKADEAGLVAQNSERKATMTQVADATDATLRPFKVNIPQPDLDELRARIKATRWSDKETVSDQSQGVQMATMQALMGYWGTDYDWRKIEAKLNSLPMFVTTIDGLDIQFIHVRSHQPNALPLIITHGWPGSILELLKVIDPLTNPTAHGASAADAFDIVLPSMPGYGFSGKPTAPGWDPAQIARAWAALMTRLGYTRFVAQGGDWGSPVSESMARQAPAGLRGIHVNLPAAVPNEILAVLNAGGPAPATLSEAERKAFDELDAGRKAGSSTYFAMMTARPQIIGYGVTDSPVGLASWLLNHPGFGRWTASGGDPTKSNTNLTKEDVFDDITLYWLTNTGSSSSRLYWENKGRSPVASAAWNTTEIKIPVAITVFPGESYQVPETWARRAYPTLNYFHVVDKGGHFAAWEQPELFSSEMRAAFKTLR